MKRLLKHILILAFAAGFAGTACENNELNVETGTFPETGNIGLSKGILQSDNYANESPVMNMDHQSISDGFHIRLTEPAPQAKAYTVDIDESKVADFNSKNGTSYPLFPANFVTLGSNGKMTIEKGKQQSNSISIDFAYDKAIEDSVIYVLPLTVEENNSSASLSEERQTLYYIINVWGMAPAEYDAIEKGFIQIAGVDPEFTNPLLLNKLYLEATGSRENFNPFDIINLQFATIKADDNRLPSVYLKDDLAYVLGKRGKYIVPLQQLNHKVCLAIKGGGEGIGFSNLGERERDILIKRIIQIIDMYQLDGVNLYDINFSYKKTDNNFDYSINLCKFVSSLRAELGDKIITYTQTSESPEGITNDEAVLKLGEFVDYAWTDQLNIVVNPWGAPDDWTMPIAGITKDKWAALNSDIHLTNDDKRYLTQAIAPSPRGSIMNAGLNHVFVINRVEYTTVGLESNATFYMSWGAKCNLRTQYGNVGIGSPNRNQHLNIHDPLMPKDY